MLGGAAKRVELDDGSHLNVIDVSDLTDFICLHAWFEGDEVALPREDRVCLLGNLTGRTPKKRRKSQSSSGRLFPNVASSFPVETEQHELEPEETGADELEPDEMAVDDEDGCDDDTASAWKKLKTSQKRVIQNIHHNCGHPSKEKFLRALRLSRAQPDFFDYVRREFECPACAAKGHEHGFQQRCHGPSASTRHSVWIFSRLIRQMAPKSFSATWCVGTLYHLCIPIPDKLPLR